MMSLTISSVLFVISGYLTNIWLGRVLGPKDYGIFGIVISLMTIINLIQTAGVPQALAKVVSEHINQRESLLYQALLLQSILTATLTSTLFISAPIIAQLLRDESLIPYIQLSAFILPFYGLYALFASYYNGLHNFSKQALLNSIYAITKAIAVVILAIKLHVVGAIAGFIISPLLTILFGISKPKKNKTNISYISLISFSIPLVCFALVLSLLQSVDLFILKSLVAENQLPGLYTASQNIARIPYFALSAFSAIIYPKVAKTNSQKNNQQTKNLIQHNLRLLLMILIPLTTFIAIKSKDMLLFLFSSEYTSASYSLTILSLGYGFLTVFLFLANIMNGSNNQKLSLVISIVGLFIVIIISLLITPFMNLNGVAIATTVGSIIITMIAATMVYKRYGILINRKTLINIISASTVSSIISTLVQIPHQILPLTFIFYFLLYGVLLLAQKELEYAEIDKIKKVILTRLKK